MARNYVMVRFHANLKHTWAFDSPLANTWEISSRHEPAAADCHAIARPCMAGESLRGDGPAPASSRDGRERRLDLAPLRYAIPAPEFRR